MTLAGTAGRANIRQNCDDTHSRGGTQRAPPGQDQETAGGAGVWRVECGEWPVSRSWQYMDKYGERIPAIRDTIPASAQRFSSTLLDTFF